MSALRRSVRSAVTVCLLAAAACLSSAPPAPPARWFDPLPAAAPDAAPTAAPRVQVRVVAAPHLGRDFVVRVGERELAFDGENRWIADPQQMVATVLERALRGKNLPADAVIVAELEAFELDIIAEPRARVRLRVVSDVAGVRSRELHVVVPSQDRSPASFAEAMAKALADVASAIRSDS